MRCRHLPQMIVQSSFRVLRTTEIIGNPPTYQRASLHRRLLDRHANLSIARICGSRLRHLVAAFVGKRVA